MQALMQRETKLVEASSARLAYPEKISGGRIQVLIAKGIDPTVAAIDLEMVKMKLRQPSEEVNWTEEQSEDAEVEYKRYLTLCLHYPYPRFSVVPNKIMDTMWHYHILDTRAYHRDCERVFGGYVHHYPYFGLRGKEDAQRLKETFEETKKLYEREFGEPMARSRESDCWHDCSDRCWHACSDGDE